MSPQLPGLNRGIWKLLESATGAWTYSRQHTLIVYAGNIYDVAKDKKIGAGQVVVPDYLYKIVIDKNICPMEVHSFCQHIGGNKNPHIISRRFMIGIKSCLDKFTTIRTVASDS